MTDGLGYVVISGHRFPIQHVGLWNSECRVMFVLPPGEAFTGPITIFGADGKGCWQGRVVEVPSRTGSLTISYGIRTHTIDEGDPIDVMEVWHDHPDE